MRSAWAARASAPPIRSAWAVRASAPPPIRFDLVARSSTPPLLRHLSSILGLTALQQLALSV